MHYYNRCKVLSRHHGQCLVNITTPTPRQKPLVSASLTLDPQGIDVMVTSSLLSMAVMTESDKQRSDGRCNGSKRGLKLEESMLPGPLSVLASRLDGAFEVRSCRAIYCDRVASH